MNQAKEDALIKECCPFEGFAPKWADIRLAIRAAYAQGVAQERERAAKVCEEHEPKDYTTAGIMTRMICAAAIRRGE